MPWGTQQTEHRLVKAKSQVQIDKLNLLIKNAQIREHLCDMQHTLKLYFYFLFIKKRSSFSAGRIFLISL